MLDKLFIRCDADAISGLGHLMRCTALANMLRSTFSINFICRSIPENLAASLLQQNHSVIIIEEEDTFIASLRAQDTVILDGYSFGKSYQLKIKAKGCSLVCIDDVHDSEFVADCIINHTPGITRKDYHAPFDTLFALGLDYTLLRQPFLQAARSRMLHKRNKPVNKNIVICFGGADPLNITERVLTIVGNFLAFEKIHIVTGELYRFADKLVKYKTIDSRIILHSAVSDEEMTRIMMDSSIAIVPASSILFETIACGCTPVTGIYIDNQKLVYSNFLQLGCVHDAANFNDQAIAEAIAKALADKEKRKQLIDGNAVERFQKIFRQLSMLAKIFLTEVTANELDITYRWATDQRIRNFSFSRNTISYEEHIAWLQSKIADSNCVYLLAKLGNDYIGSIRFDEKEQTQLISYQLDPAFQGKGLGQLLLQSGMKYMISRAGKRDLKFEGQVMEVNIGSIKAFRKLGFHETKEKEYIKFELTLNE